MAFDEQLAHRVRDLLADERGVTERRMFGGLAFLVDGNMAVSASSRGGLLVRVAPDDRIASSAGLHARRFEMRGRAMNGWLHVDVEGVRDEAPARVLDPRGVACARSLPGQALGGPPLDDRALGHRTGARTRPVPGRRYAGGGGGI